MAKDNEFVKFDKVDKSYDGKVLVIKDLKRNQIYEHLIYRNRIICNTMPIIISLS